MKNQMEFHCMYTNDAFVIDPESIFKVGKWMDGAMVYTTHEGALEVSESYEKVRSMLNDYHFPNANVSGYPYE